jgi:hypothetical protein
LVLTVVYKNKATQVPSQHESYNLCSSVAVATPNVATLVVFATLSVTTPVVVMQLSLQDH